MLYLNTSVVVILVGIIVIIDNAYRRCAGRG